MQSSTAARIAATGQETKLRDAARVAAELGVALHWAGGGVRDLLLGRARLDLDLVVEGEVDPLVTLLAGLWHGNRVQHARFQTATVRLPDATRVDVSRARRERYSAVAQLPTVEPASLDEDLRRRDFTVNAMAITLAPEASFGALIDPLGGRADLTAGRLRVHHDRSFQDDPTRILRGVRFEIRLGFHFTAETERLAREAIANGAMAALSSSRFGAEMEQLFGDGGEPGAILARLEDLGLLTELELGDVRWSRPAALSGLVPEPWRSVLLDLACSCGAAAREELARRLALPASERELVTAGPDRVAEAARVLFRGDLEPSRAREALVLLGDEELARVAGESQEAGTWIERYVRELRSFRLSIGARDLLAAGVEPGPALGLALRRTRDARLDGRIDARGELRFALQLCRSEGSR